MGRDINIQETIEDRKTWFNIKRFTIGNTRFEKPEKGLDLKAVDSNTFGPVVRKHDFKLCEATRVLRSFDDIRSIYEEDNNVKIAAFFYKRNWLRGTPKVLNLTFEFNPLLHSSKKETITGFFDHYYQYSTLFLSVPNIRTNRVYTAPTRRKEIIVDVDAYIRAVDYIYEILDTKNGKPIFVPVSLRMSQRELDVLIEHYLKKQYYYYWFDFEGKPVYEVTLGRLRHLFRKIKDKGYYDKTIAHFSNVKREIISNVKSETSPGSDVLCSIAGANIIGVNREPRRIPQKPSQFPPPEHKARILQTSSYYYVKTNASRLHTKSRYTTRNAIILEKEFGDQTQYFLQSASVEKLLDTKRMLSEYHNGEVLKYLVSKAEEPTGGLEKWFG